MIPLLHAHLPPSRLPKDSGAPTGSCPDSGIGGPHAAERSPGEVSARDDVGGPAGTGPPRPEHAVLPYSASHPPRPGEASPPAAPPGTEAPSSDSSPIVCPLLGSIRPGAEPRGPRAGHPHPPPSPRGRAQPEPSRPARHRAGHPGSSEDSFYSDIAGNTPPQSMESNAPRSESLSMKSLTSHSTRSATSASCALTGPHSSGSRLARSENPRKTPSS